jgi:hypothetical protein
LNKFKYIFTTFHHHQTFIKPAFFYIFVAFIHIHHHKTSLFVCMKTREDFQDLPMDDWRRSSRQDGVRPSEDGETVGKTWGREAAAGE